MQTDSFRLVDLLLDTSLGLDLVSDCDPNVPVSGAHSIEIAHPAEWLEPGTVMLTTGSLYGADATADPAAANPAQAYRGLIRELVTAGVSALGYGIGVITDDVPRALIDEANRHHFAVFTVPPEVAFMTVIKAVIDATHAAETQSLRRELQMQNLLLDALAATAPEQELVARLAALLRSSVLLYNEFGDVIASSGRAPSHLVRAQLRGRGGRLRFRVGKWFVAAESIEPGSEPHWLVVASTRHAIPDAMARSAVAVSLRLLNAIERSRYRAAMENRTRQAQFVRALVAGEIVDELGAQDHLEALRFGHRPVLRIFSIIGSADYDGGRWNARAATVLDAMEADAGDLGKLMRLPVMFAQHDGELIGVLPAHVPALSGWVSNLSEGIVCGFSEPFQEVRTGPERHRNAQRARRAAETRGVRTVNFEDVGIADWLLTGHDRDTTTAKAAAQLAPLEGKQDYVDFLRVFFANNLDVVATATAMSVHPNTIRHRVKRVEEMFGEPIRSPALITALHLSLEVLALER